jgi:hypothetical protein
VIRPDVREMSDLTEQLTDEGTVEVRFDRTAVWAIGAFVALLVLLAAFVVYSRMGDSGRPYWLPAGGWPLTFAVLLLVLLALFALDFARRKNIAWRLIRRHLGLPPDAQLDRKNYGAGRGRIGGHMYSGLRCFGSPGGLGVVRMLSAVNRPLYLPWSDISTIDAYPNLLTGKPGFETDMQARITLRRQASLTVEVPWLAEFRQLTPDSVKFRSTRLPGEAPPKKRWQRQRRGRR